jgi:hypothetical protein
VWLDGSSIGGFAKPNFSPGWTSNFEQQISTSTKQFYSAAVPADGILIPHLRQALIVGRNVMKTTLHILILLFLTTTFCFGQTNNVPKTLKQAVLFLDKDCTDSLKKLIKATEDKNLSKLSYPWGGDYKTIFNWTSDDNENSKIVQYLNSKGVSSHQTEVILIAFKQFLLAQKFDENSICKPFQLIEIKLANEDKVRFTTDSLRGVYIPKDLEDCFKQINSFWADSTKLKMKKLTENEFSSRLHLGFGMWMRNNWQLWGGSRLSKYFNDKGIHHPDDISGIILDSYYRNLNKQEIKLEEQIKYYQDYWEKSKIAVKERKEKEFSEFQLGDTLLYKYHLGYVSSEQEKKFDNDICIAKGVIIEFNKEKFFIKVKLIESCDRKGIIYYDNKNNKILNEKTKKWEKPKKREIKRMKVREENWFNYDDWDSNK